MWRLRIAVLSFGLVLLVAFPALAQDLKAGNTPLYGWHEPAKILYVWAGDQARVAPDFLAVINFDEDSGDYGKVIATVPVPHPGNLGNEPHHCHLSADKNILACGGLLSLLRGQNSIFFFVVSSPRYPTFLFFPIAPQPTIPAHFPPSRRRASFAHHMPPPARGGP